MPISPTYVRASTTDEATDVLAQFGPDAAILSGGQSLLPMMSAGLAAPDVLVDINRLPTTNEAELDEHGLLVGARVRHRQLEHASPSIDAAAPALRPAGRLIAHAAVRNRGTMVGSICHADPAAEWPAVALATDACIVLNKAGAQTREVAASDFFLGPMSTARDPDELATHVRIPAAAPNTYAAVRELTYRDGDYAIVGAIAQLTFDADTIADCRLVLFAVDRTPVRARHSEEMLVDGGLAALDDAAHAARDVVDPISDATASRDYRLSMVSVFLSRAVEDAYRRSGRPADQL